ncbi:hypothetical protein O6H91_Y086900 [Diphasiastrum complanatum]|nr:hypothetical protein O6H91_Y086900 [Diphasiastrum complanatum]
MKEETPLFVYHALAPLGECSSADASSDVSEQFTEAESYSIPLNTNSARLGLEMVESPSMAHPITHLDYYFDKPMLSGDVNTAKASAPGGTSTSPPANAVVTDKRRKDAGRILESERLGLEGLNSVEKVPILNIDSSDSDRFEDEASRGEADVEYLSLGMEEGELIVKDEHFQSLETTKAVKRIAPSWTPLQLGGIGRIRSPLLQLHQEIVNFCEFIAPTQEEEQERVAAIQRVCDVVKSIWPHCTVKVFGSSATGLFLPTSDVDVVILNSGCEVPQNGLKALATAFRRKSMVKNLQVIGKARVPIIKFVEVRSKIAFDISFDVPNGPDAAEFIKEAIAALPPLKPLCMVLKMFLQQRELNEVYTGGLGSYALLVMLLTHLQMHPSRHIRSNFDNQNALEDNLGVLLVDFLDLYGRALNIRDVGISCRDGGRFFSKLSRGFVDAKRPYLLSVEDPQAPDNDIGKNSYNIQKVRSAFILAQRLLTSSNIVESSFSHGILGRIVRVDSHLVGRKVFGLSKSLQFSENDDEDDENNIDYGQDRWLGDDKEALPRQTDAELSQRARKRQKQRHRHRNELREDAIEYVEEDRAQKSRWLNNPEEDFQRGGSAGLLQHSLKRKRQENRKTVQSFVNDSDKGLDDYFSNEYEEKLSRSTIGNSLHSKHVVIHRKQKGKNGKGQSAYETTNNSPESRFGRYSDLRGSELFEGEAKASRKRKRNKVPKNYIAPPDTTTSSKARRRKMASKAISERFDRDNSDVVMLHHKGRGHAGQSSIIRKELYKDKNNPEHAKQPLKQRGWQRKQVQKGFVRGRRSVGSRVRSFHTAMKLVLVCQKNWWRRRGSTLPIDMEAFLSTNSRKILSMILIAMWRPSIPHFRRS